MIGTKSKIKGTLLFLAVIITGTQLAFAQSTSEPEGYHYFPSNKKSSQLALTAQGSFVKMSYTPATYEIRLDPGKEFIEVEIFDAPLKPGSNSEDVNDSGKSAFMKLVFSENGSDWKVKCKTNDETLAKSGSQAEVREFIISPITPCQFNEKDWGETLKIYPGSDRSSLLMKTVWDDTKENQQYSYSTHKDLINVFKFRTRNGTINLASTDPNTIIQFPGQTGFDFKQEAEKHTFAHAVNWAILYNTKSSAVFDFEIDVTGKNEVLLFDKDGDANKLYGPTTPSDDGITMSVVWNDGSNTPVRDWTIFNQTNRGTFTDSNYVPGEQNSYQGPSGDTGTDEEGLQSIQWYKIPVSEQKASSIKVTWSGFEVDYNGFGFASTSSMKPFLDEPVEEELNPDDICDPSDELCLEALEKCNGNLKCLEKLKDCEGDQQCIEDLLDELNNCELPSAICPLEDPTTTKCRESGYLRACITSTPYPDPHPDSYLDKGDTITYHITLENTSTPEQNMILQNLNIGFETPTSTTLSDSHLSEIIPPAGTGSYTGKGPGRFEMASSLPPGSSINKNISVQLDEEIPFEDYDISTLDKIIAGASNNPSVTLKPLLHHVGNGAVSVTVTRCYAYDYSGGEFQCNNTCSTIEPGTWITVRDTLTNKGGLSAFNHNYSPPPLSASFQYEASSIRIDDPISGLSVSNDGQTFPPSGGITIPGPIEKDQSRTVYFRYLVPEDVLVLDPPKEEEERDGKCYPRNDELYGVEEGYSAIEFEADCAADDSSEEARNGLICVKVEENPKLVVELESIPSADNPVYQGSIITYIVRVTNTTKQPVVNLIIEGLVPDKTTCKSDNCNGVNLTNPVELQGKGSYEYTFSVEVDEDASGSSIVHPGQRIFYKGESEQIFEAESSPLIHPLIAAPEPTGDFQHDISLNRRTVLNSKDGNARGDEGDRSVISHRFSYTGTKKTPVWPQMSKYRGYQTNVCSSSYPSYEYYDASWNASTINYNSTNRSSQLTSFDSIGRAPITFQITTDLPDDRPELLEYTNESHRHQFDYVLPPEAVNSYMKDGRTITETELQKTVIRAVKDGDIGEITTENIAITPLGQGFVSEDLWVYSFTTQRIDVNRCVICGEFSCSYYDAVVPVYRWRLVSSRNIPLQNSDKDYITVLTSVAWLQTKNGNMGFGEAFWKNIPQSGDPNLVDLGDRFIASQMKVYSPPGEYNADLLLYSPDGSDPLTSRMGSSAKIQSQSIPQGFIDPTGSGQMRLSRGEAYDRSEYPRDFLDDLINKQVYGKVVRLNTDSNRPTGMVVNGANLFVSGTVSFNADTIYHFKGDVTIGGSSPVTIAGGRARLVVEGNVRILSDVAYSKNVDPDLNKIPSLRLHATKNISVDPSVTDIELMMLAENEFHSGRSDRQLRILGDVIAYKTFWERAPLNEERVNEEVINKPSEIIYEDFRKYVLTPPGDKKLPDPGHYWREVSAGSGK